MRTNRHPMPRYFTCIASLVTGVSACGVDGRIETAAVRDSLGVTIVESRASTWSAGQGWVVSGDPSLRIGVAAGHPEYEFHDVRDVRRLGDGRIVVANAGSRELRFYDTDGQFIRSVGREGSAPGEFRRIAGIYSIRGDSILVYDDGLRRMSVLDAGGGFVRSFHFEPVAYELVWPEGYLTDGSLLAGSSVPMSSRTTTGIERGHVQLLRFDLDGQSIDSLGSFPGAERYVEIMGDLRTTIGGPFRRISRFVAREGGFWVGTGDSFELVGYSLDGRKDRIIRLDRQNRAVTPADVERYLEIRLDGLDPQAAPSIRRAIRESPFPETMPSYSQILVDEEDHVWVSEYVPPGEVGTTMWFIFAPGGEFLGVLELPGGLGVHQIGSDFVLGVHRDELGLEEVHLYQLDRVE